MWFTKILLQVETPQRPGSFVFILTFKADGWQNWSKAGEIVVFVSNRWCNPGHVAK